MTLFDSSFSRSLSRNKAVLEANCGHVAK